MRVVNIRWQACSVRVRWCAVVLECTCVVERQFRYKQFETNLNKFSLEHLPVGTQEGTFVSFLPSSSPTLEASSPLDPISQDTIMLTHPRILLKRKGPFELPLRPATIKDIEDEADVLAHRDHWDYLKRLKVCYAFLSNAICRTVQGNNENYVYWRQKLCLVFTNIPLSILTAAIGSTLAYRHLTQKEEDIAKYYDYIPRLPLCDQHPWIIQASDPSTPAIYGRFSVGNDGRSPSLAS